MMHTLRLPTLVLAALVVLPVLPTTTAASSGSPALEVHVNVPPTWRPFLDEDISRAFVSRVADTFRRGGFDGQVTELTRFDDRKPGAPGLDISLNEWRVNRTGNVECTFHASFIDADGQAHSLGMFNATEFNWGSNNRWQLTRAFEDAAESAATRLWRKLVEEGHLAPTPRD
jgi:hypothetical protein